MSVVNELIKKLREIANCYYGEIRNYVSTIEEAADTIESLSAKLQAANIERSSEDCGGWIPCKNKLPDKNGMYLVTLQNVLDESLCILDTVHYISKWDIGGIEDDFVVTAWCELPEPYHEH